MVNDIREPKQKRSIEKKERIIDAGWKLISTGGYYNTNTAEIAKAAGVSTGIVYQYFKDKHDILIAGLSKYGSEVFYPVIKLDNIDLNRNNVINMISDMIDSYIDEHSISKDVHAEIMAMVHIDKEVASFFYNREIDLTNELYNIFLNIGIDEDRLLEKVHIIIGLIDNLCHEVVYHRHTEMNYISMKEIVIDIIKKLILN